MNNIIGEVVEMDWAKTALLEVDPESFNYTGKHVYVPNSQLVTQTVRNLNFMRRYRLHSFEIVNEPSVNAYSLLPAFHARAQAHCEYFRDVAERYKGLIERHLEQEFIRIDPEVEIKTNELAKVVVKVLVLPYSRSSRVRAQNVLRLVKSVVQSAKKSSASFMHFKRRLQLFSKNKLKQCLKHRQLLAVLFITLSVCHNSFVPCSVAGKVPCKKAIWSAKIRLFIK